MVAARPRSTSAERNGLAAVYILMAVLGYSLTSLFITMASGEANPFLFNAASKLGFVFGLVCFLVSRYRRELLNRSTYSMIFSGVMSWTMFFAVITYFDLLVYAWPTRFMDISIVVLIDHIWPILYIAFICRLFRVKGRYLKSTPRLMLFLPMDFVGFFCTVASQTGKWITSITRINPV